LKQQRTLTIECAFQGSKVFQRGGPYVDMFEMTPREAKKDKRLLTSGRLTGFKFFGKEWELEPRTAFYDWLYISALKKRIELADQVIEYSAFTDIEFNPERSINCQAYSAALYVSLFKQGILDEAIATKESFLKTIKSASISNALQDETTQSGFGFWNKREAPKKTGRFPVRLNVALLLILALQAAINAAASFSDRVASTSRCFLIAV
jgi:hypothetical protein